LPTFAAQESRTVLVFNSVRVAEALRAREFSVLTFALKSPRADL
jgi:hypothetical protein